jgi:hypothetical protein
MNREDLILDQAGWLGKRLRVVHCYILYFMAGVPRDTPCVLYNIRLEINGSFACSVEQ